jgi:hypothetical protein
MVSHEVAATQRPLAAVRAATTRIASSAPNASAVRPPAIAPTPGRRVPSLRYRVAFLKGEITSSGIEDGGAQSLGEAP